MKFAAQALATVGVWLSLPFTIHQLAVPGAKIQVSEALIMLWLLAQVIATGAIWIEDVNL